MNAPLKILLSILSFLILLSSPSFAWQCNGHVAFGIPGNTDQLLCRKGYAVGYDYTRKIPIWVAYHISAESVEPKFKRSNHFREDDEVPESFRSTLSDYKGSGYDRGHMAPAATVDFSKESMEESFLLTNMAPQLPGLNRQGWRYLEAYIREWAVNRGDLYVVSGALFDQDPTVIGDGVNVPNRFYKVVYDPTEKDAIAFIVPHRKFTKSEIPNFIVSIDEVEAQSGFDFLSKLPDALEDDIEDDVATMWNGSKPMASKREEVSLEEALHTEILINQALIDLLVQKGIITHEELMERIQTIRTKQ